MDAKRFESRLKQLEERFGRKLQEKAAVLEENNPDYLLAAGKMAWTLAGYSQTVDSGRTYVFALVQIVRADTQVCPCRQQNTMQRRIKEEFPGSHPKQLAHARAKSMNKIISCLVLTAFFASLPSCGPEQDIPVNQNYGKGEYIKITKFYADWCPPCQEMRPEYEKVKKIYQYIEFDEVEVDRHTAKAAAYNITGVPVVVMQKNGKEIKRQPGYMNRNEIVRFIEDN